MRYVYIEKDVLVRPLLMKYFSQVHMYLCNKQFRYLFIIPPIVISIIGACDRRWLVVHEEFSRASGFTCNIEVRLVNASLENW